MDKDQIKELIKELRSKGLSYQKIADALRKSYSIDLSYSTVRLYLKESMKNAPDDSQGENKQDPQGLKKNTETYSISVQGPAMNEIQSEEKNEQKKENTKTYQPIRFPGFEDEDLKKDPYYELIPDEYLKMTPEQRYEDHLNYEREKKEERNRMIGYAILMILVLLGMFLGIRYGII